MNLKDIQPSDIPALGDDYLHEVFREAMFAMHTASDFEYATHCRKIMEAAMKEKECRRLSKEIVDGIKELGDLIMGEAE